MGDRIGWESDNATVGPAAATAKTSLLRLIPHILPPDSEQGELYRLVLEHGDYGIHNMTITIDPNTKQPRVTSIYDWETGHITPAILSDPEMAVIVDLTTNADAKPMVTRVKADATTAERTTFASWATHYSKVCSLSTQEARYSALTPYYRSFSVVRQNTKRPLKLAKTPATSGLLYEPGEDRTRKDTSVRWDTGLTRESKCWVKSRLLQRMVSLI